jgi:hypothetical protein
MAFEFENWAVIALGGIPNKVEYRLIGVNAGGPGVPSDVGTVSAV